ncbi:hypothetical protein WDR10_11095 [Kurthia gibsonii]|uniref:hypothetical protein n=1 Tax=Kurthia gibsonii TaxID=33946 RepID=UPI0030CD355F
MKDLLGYLVDKSMFFLQRFFRNTDDSISRLLLVIEKNKKVFDIYFQKRKVLEKTITESQNKIIVLQRKNEELKNTYSEKILFLYKEIEEKQSFLQEKDKVIYTLKDQTNIIHKKINGLYEEKAKYILERNYLKAEYDNLQRILKANFESQNEYIHKIKELENQNSELNQLKKQEYELILKNLKEEKKEYEKSFSITQTNLINSMKKVTTLHTNIKSLENELSEKEKQIHYLQEQQYILQNRLDYVQHEKSLLYIQFENAKEKAKHEKEQLESILKEKREYEKELNEIEALYGEELQKAESDIQVLKIRLLEEQNNLAIEKANQGAPHELNIEELKILEQEYEPRFAELYKNCFFHKEFFRDFFTLIPSDRLRVEACIVNLTYRYEENVHKIRPNNVRTNRKLTINEYPFGQDCLGRIYFKKRNHQVEFYRISRTKNGKGDLNQQQVIAWLQKNY